ncbi:MAG: class I SAM-dependent methyltransferase [Deltaproteobacteria bacterium]|nr:class I SAM-dependent methyltransferase [Deltaproteobacteria bacterium]
MQMMGTRDLIVYLKEDRYENPKEIFKLLADMVRRSGLKLSGSVICDIGCATGEFIYFLKKQFPESNYIGIDIEPDLINKACQNVKGVEFKIGSVLDQKILPHSSIDIAFLNGVHSIFDDFKDLLFNLLHWTRPGGRIFIFGPFNPYPVDVWVKFRLADDPDLNRTEPGWNIFSKQTISGFLNKNLGEGRHSYTHFEMPFDIDPDPYDPVRSWTFKDNNNRRLFTNGLSLLINFEVLEIIR